MIKTQECIDILKIFINNSPQNTKSYIESSCSSLTLNSPNIKFEFQYRFFLNKFLESI